MRPIATRSVALVAMAATLLSCAKDATGFFVNVTLAQGIAVSLPFSRVEIKVYNASTAGAAPTFISSTTYNGTVSSLPFKVTVGSSGLYRRVLVETLVYNGSNMMEPAAIGRATATFVDQAVMILPIEVSAECRTTQAALMNPLRPGEIRPGCGMGQPGVLCAQPLSACDPSQTCRVTTAGQPPTCVDSGVSGLRSYY